jgi:hypothetical protein
MVRALDKIDFSGRSTAITIMAINVTAYRNLRPVRDPVFNDYGHLEDTETQVWLMQPLGIEEETPNRMAWIENGIYTFGEKVTFRAGSHRAYRAWLDELARLVGHPNSDVIYDAPDGTVSGPFIELLNFRPEGVLGPDVSTKLAQDFIDHWDAAFALNDAKFTTQYALWMKAFRMAANRGAVRFH